MIVMVLNKILLIFFDQTKKCSVNFFINILMQGTKKYSHERRRRFRRNIVDDDLIN